MSPSQLIQFQSNVGYADAEFDTILPMASNAAISGPILAVPGA
jgi:hypothetical protein